MVVGASAHQRVALGHQRRRERARVGLDAADVLAEGGARRLAQRHGEGGDLVVVGSALQRREDGLVDGLLEALAVEDHAGARAAEALVRGGRHHVRVLEGVVDLPGGHEARDVCHVAQQQRAHLRRAARERGGEQRTARAAAGLRRARAHLVADLAHAPVVPLARVGGGAGDDHLWPEESRPLLQALVVDEPRGGVHLGPGARGGGGGCGGGRGVVVGGGGGGGVGFGGGGRQWR